MELRVQCLGRGNAVALGVVLIVGVGVLPLEFLVVLRIPTIIN